MSNPATNAIVERLKAQHAAMNKQAAEDTGGVSDPNDRGTTSIPKDEKANPALAALPQNPDGTPAARNDSVAMQDTKAGPNCPVPSTGDQNAKDDAATSPTTELGKIAGNLRNLMQEFKTGVKVEEQPKQADAPAPGWDPAVLTKLAGDLGLDEQTLSAMTPESFAEFTRNKLANTMALILQVEGGADTVGEILEKKAGQDEARLAMQQAVNSYALFSKEASYAEQQAALQLQEMQAVQDSLARQFNELTADATPSDLTKIAHYEAAITAVSGKFNADGLQAYITGMKRAAADVEGIEQGMDPAALEAGAMPEGAEGMEGMEGEGAISELEQALQMALEQGKITPEMAAQIIQELQGMEGMGGEGQEGEVPPEVAAEEDIKAACAGLGIEW